MKKLVVVSSLAVVLAIGAEQAAGQFMWIKDARNPVVSGGAAGTWNRCMDQPCVLFNPDSTRYELWYAASYGQTPDWRPMQIGYAFSKDGINWTMYPSPLLSPDSGKWDSYTVEMPRVIREGEKYKMWYTGCPNGTFVPCYTGYATSPDGVHWTKYPGNPILGPGSSAWEAGGAYIPFIMPVSSGYRMWYCGYNASASKGQVGYAVSADGVAWTRDTVNNPVCKNGDVGQWDDAWVDIPNVLKIGSTYFLWYMGQRANSSSMSVGVATSPDSGISWTKYAGNPVLAPSPGTWDGLTTQIGSVLRRGDSLEMWYSSGNPGKIGHALSAVVVGAMEGERALPEGFLLHQNYPNPFNPSTTIRYGLPQQSHMNLAVYNTLGEQVAVLKNGEEEAGYHDVTFNASTLPSGVYFYRLQVGSYVETRKLCLVR
jgi:predicted GH43/DUF377 family glycosyl hydrolase